MCIFPKETSTASQLHEFQNVSDEIKDGGAMRNVRVNLGIDEDLRMILDMDPSIIDLGNTNMQEYAPVNNAVAGLPPRFGGYVLLIDAACFDTLSRCFLAAYRMRHTITKIVKLALPAVLMVAFFTGALTSCQFKHRVCSINYQFCASFNDNAIAARRI